MELFNEVIFHLVTYHFICFSDFVLDLERQFQVGYSLFGVLGLLLFVHFGNMISNTFTRMRLKRQLSIKAKAVSEAAIKSKKEEVTEL